MQFRYAAFISYSHTDDKIARWLHRRLESYAIPSGIAPDQGVKSILGRRLGKIFRDREEFPAGGELTRQIEEALASSQHLLVLCSQHSAASKFVDSEIRHFMALGGADRVIPVILDGDPPDCFPPSLRASSDRLGADLRVGKDGKDGGLIKIVSGLLSVGPDDLFQRQRRRQRWIVGLMSAAAAVFALVAAVAVIQSQAAIEQRRMAVANAQEAQMNAERAEVQSKLAVANAKEAKNQEEKAVKNAKLAEQRALAEKQQRHRAEDALAQVFAQRAMNPVASPPSRVRYALAGLTLFPSHESALHLALGATLQDQERLRESIGSMGATPLWVRKDASIIFRGETGALFERASGAEAIPRVLTQPIQEVRDMALSPDQSLLAIAEKSGALSLVVRSTHEEKWRLQSSVGLICSLTFSPDGEWIALSGESGKAEVRNVFTGKLAYRMEPDRLALYKIVYSRSGELIATASHKGEVQIWRASDGYLLHRLVGHSERLRDLLFLGDGSLLASASMDKTIRIWDARSGTSLRTIDAHDNWVDALATDRSGNTLISGSSDATAKIWNTVDGSLQAVLPKFGGPVYGVDIDADGRLVAAGSADGTAVLAEAETGIVLSQLRAHEGGPVYKVKFSDDGSQLLTIGAIETLRLWDARRGGAAIQDIAQAVVERRTVQAKSDHGQMFVDNGGKVRIIDLASRQTVHTLEGHESRVVHVAVSLDGSLVATASQDNTARVWQRNTGHLITILRGHIFPLELVALSPDGRFAATASRDETVRLWHVPTGRELIRWPTRVRWMDSLGFSSDGNKLIAEGERQSFMWSIERLNWPLTKAVEFACTHLLSARQRMFTTDERENDPLVRNLWLQNRAVSYKDLCDALHAHLSTRTPVRTVVSPLARSQK